MYSFEEREFISLHLLVSQYVGLTHIVQYTSQEQFAPEASKLVFYSIRCGDAACENSGL